MILAKLVSCHSLAYLAWQVLGSPGAVLRSPGAAARTHGPGAADSEDSESAADPNLVVEECLRCRWFKRRFATASALRRHTSHRHLRNSECAEQKRKNPRLLISSSKPRPAHRSDGRCTAIEEEHAAPVLASGDLIESILLADNANKPADAAPSHGPR